LLDFLDCRAQRERLDGPVLVDFRVRKEMQENQDLMDVQVHRELKETLVEMDYLALTEDLVRLVMQVCLDQLDFRDR